MVGGAQGDVVCMQDGRTALEVAAKEGKSDVVALLKAKHKSNSSFGDNGDTNTESDADASASTSASASASAASAACPPVANNRSKNAAATAATATQPNGGKTKIRFSRDVLNRILFDVKLPADEVCD